MPCSVAVLVTSMHAKMAILLSLPMTKESFYSTGHTFAACKVPDSDAVAPCAVMQYVHTAMNMACKLVKLSALVVTHLLYCSPE